MAEANPPGPAPMMTTDFELGELMEGNSMVTLRGKFQTEMPSLSNTRDNASSSNARALAVET